MAENKGGSSNRHQEFQISFGMMQPSSSSLQASAMSKEGGGAYDMGELDQALFLYLDGQDHSSAQEHRQTLNIFPSQPMHVEPFNKGGMSLTAPSASSKRPADQSMELGNQRNNATSLAQPNKDTRAVVKKDSNAKKGTTSSTEQEGPKTPDAKTIRRLAQNREAARKSRLRKKAYVQQLENSRIRLTQLEQELQRSRTQGVFFGGGGLLGDQGLPHGINGLSSEAAMFDMELARWMEEHHRLMCELRAAVQEHLPEHELRLYVDNCLSHYDEIMGLKSAIVKADVFHLVSGMWKTPAERCFMWMGGFRPSELIKVSSTTETLTLIL